MSALSRLAVAASILDFETKRFFRGLLQVNTIAAAGANQAAATAITTAKAVVTGADGTKGVRLPVTELDMETIVVNTDASNDLKVYPSSGAAINALSANAAFTVVAGAERVFRCDAANHWYVAAGNLTGSSLSASGATAAAGFTGGTGTVYQNSVVKEGGVIRTSFLVDLTGLGSSTTDLDIIGQGVSAAYFGRIVAALSGTILGGRVTCLEVPATGADDIDFYSAVEATGAFDAAITGLTETALLTSGGAWTLGQVKAISNIPAANEYLYMTGGEAGTAGTYTAGKFLIELYGY